MADLIELFDAWALAGRAEGMERGHSVPARMAFEALRLPLDGSFLDIGCGNGYAVRWAAAAAPRGRALGIDAAPLMIERAREAARGIANAEFLVSAFPAASLPAQSFDAIFSMEAFYYFPDLNGALQDVARLLKPSGRFACVVDYYAENTASHSWPADLGVTMTLLDEAGWAEAFRRAGLRVVEQRRLRTPAGEASSGWKETEGSLLTLGDTGLS